MLLFTLNLLYIFSLLQDHVVYAKEFNAYWNIPTFMCKKFNITFEHITTHFGIIQNEWDTFRGDAVSILYDPGNFPALLQNGTSNQLFKRNGGVPQNGNLNLHLEIFKQHINELMPDKKNDGLGIIDFESWRPVYRQNFGSLQPYKDLSMQLVHSRHPSWSDKRIEIEANKQFTAAAKTFMDATIKIAQQLRPYAKWGYYGLPFCFNGKSVHIENCGKNIQIENDSTQWLYDASDIIFPSVYMPEDIPLENRAKMVRGRVREAKRLANKVNKRQKPQIIVYYRYLFIDTLRYPSELSVFETINAIKSTGADGIILWGSSDDLKTKEKCEEFRYYLDTVLGPILKSLQRRIFVERIRNL